MLWQKSFDIPVVRRCHQDLGTKGTRCSLGSHQPVCRDGQGAHPRGWSLSRQRDGKIAKATAFEMPKETALEVCRCLAEAAMEAEAEAEVEAQEGQAHAERPTLKATVLVGYCKPSHLCDVLAGFCCCQSSRCRQSDSNVPPERLRYEVSTRLGLPSLWPRDDR